MNDSSFLNRLLFSWIPSYMRFVMVVAAVPLILLIFAQVWLRYVFQMSLLWVEEVAITPAFWMYMTGAAYAAYDKTHIRVGVLDVAVKDARRLLTWKFIASAITLSLAMLFLVWGVQFLRAGPSIWPTDGNPQVSADIRPLLILPLGGHPRRTLFSRRHN